MALHDPRLTLAATRVRKLLPLSLAPTTAIVPIRVISHHSSTTPPQDPLDSSVADYETLSDEFVNFSYKSHDSADSATSIVPMTANNHGITPTEAIKDASLDTARIDSHSTDHFGRTFKKHKAALRAALKQQSWRVSHQVQRRLSARKHKSRRDHASVSANNNHVLDAALIENSNVPIVGVHSRTQEMLTATDDHPVIANEDIDVLPVRSWWHRWIQQFIFNRNVLACIVGGAVALALWWWRPRWLQKARAPIADQTASATTDDNALKHPKQSFTDYIRHRVPSTQINSRRLIVTSAVVGLSVALLGTQLHHAYKMRTNSQ